MPMRRCVSVFLLIIFSVRIASITVSGVSPASETEKSVYSSHENESRKIAITFDDGPHPRYTAEILDILAEHGAHATFFIIGDNAKNYPDLLSRIQKEGHEIGNHTYLHRNLQKTTPDIIRKQILDAEQTILELTDQRTKLLRPPGGLYDQEVCDTARSLDYEVILWTIDTKDWTHPTVDEIVEKVEANIKTGDIILCHDFIGGGSTPTPDALRRIIPDLTREGYEFVTVSELIHSK